MSWGILPKRLASLDAFRGLTIALMILVNTPGSWAHVYPPLKHAEWHGCTPTDLVFPFFLFIVGVAMWFSLKKMNHNFSWALFQKVGRRALLIFFIGLGLKAFPFYNLAFDSFRIMGVLQRIAVAFFFGAMISWFGDGEPYTLESNFARHVDLLIFGEAHIYKGFGIPFDPEGLLSSIPAVGTVIIGFIIGSYIDARKNTKNFFPFLVLFGVALAVLGKAWEPFFPINKPLWTSSYVVYTCGLATILLAIFIWVIDVKRWKKWAQPLIEYGMNPLFTFVLSILWVKLLIRVIRWSADGASMNGYNWLYQTIFVPIAGNLNGSLLFGLFHVAIFWFVAHLLYKKKIFIKV
jgi:predicted acyltransferase